MGIWSLSDISYTDYKDLLQSLTAGRYWIQGVFNKTITSGFLFGHYIYPKSVFEVLFQSGVTHLLIHHIGSNSPYYHPLLHERLYAEGGLERDGVTPSEEYPSVYRWRSASGEGEMMVYHTFQSQANVLTNLVNYRCKATVEEYVL